MLAKVRALASLSPHDKSQLARKYGIPVELGKACRELRIPGPGRGDWAKRKVAEAKQAPVTEFKDALVVRRLKAITVQQVGELVL